MPRKIAPGLTVETVGDILDRTDDDRHARMFAKAMGNEAPAEKTPYDAIKTDIEDLNDAAKQWLDGTEIATAAEATDVATLIDRLQKAWKAADEQRDKEKRPHMEAANAVQALYNPLLAKAKTAKEVAQKASTKWLIKLQAAQRAEADKAAAEALRVAQEAQAAIAEANASANLEARETAEDMVAAAQEMIAGANALAKAKPQSRGDGAARAIGLKSDWQATLSDSLLAMRHYWVIPERKAEFEMLMQQMAAKDVRAGIRSIPGFNIVEGFKV